MSVPAKLAAFAVVLVLSFGAAYGVGAAVGPIEDGSVDDGHAPTVSTPPPIPATADAEHGGEHGG